MWPHRFSVGIDATVAYDAAKPATARLVSFWTIRLLPALMAAVGTAVGLVSYFMRI